MNLFTRLRTILRPVLPGLVVIVALVALCQIYFGSLSEAVGYFNGQRLFLSPSSQYVTLTDPDAVQELNFYVRNRSSSSIKIVGGDSSCSCVLLDGLQQSVPSGASARVHVAVRAVDGAPPKAKHGFQLFTDHPAQPRLRGSVIVRITGNRREKLASSKGQSHASN